MTLYRLNELAGKYDRDNLTTYEIEKCKKETLVFDGDNCVGSEIDFLIKFKIELRKFVNNRNVEYNLQLHAHDGSGFDTWTKLNNLPCDKHIGYNIKIVKGRFSVKTCNGCNQSNKNKFLSIYFLEVE